MDTATRHSTRRTAADSPRLGASPRSDASVVAAGAGEQRGTSATERLESILAAARAAAGADGGASGHEPVAVKCAAAAPLLNERKVGSALAGPTAAVASDSALQSPLETCTLANFAVQPSDHAAAERPDDIGSGCSGSVNSMMADGKEVENVRSKAALQELSAAAAVPSPSETCSAAGNSPPPRVESLRHGYSGGASGSGSGDGSASLAGGMPAARRAGSTSSVDDLLAADATSIASPPASPVHPPASLTPAASSPSPRGDAGAPADAHSRSASSVNDTCSDAPGGSPPEPGLPASSKRGPCVVQPAVAQAAGSTSAYHARPLGGGTVLRTWGAAPAVPPPPPLQPAAERSRGQRGEYAVGVWLGAVPRRAGRREGPGHSARPAAAAPLLRPLPALKVTHRVRML